MASEEGLFSSKLISPEVSEKLPEGYQLRALRPSDFDTGFLECLRVLTTVGDITREAFEEQFKQMNQQGGYYIVVIEDTNRTEKEKSVVATGALIVERKLYVLIPARLYHPRQNPNSTPGEENQSADYLHSIHSLGAVGHIEDIAVAKDQQGKKLGLRLIQALDYVAEKVGCYKCILDCSDANEGFYVKCGFRRAGLQMAHYYQGNKSKSQ
ncbi:glucosamine 6-phosphate N-acetyltransferase [Metarhizium acridum CQMa 102]|uniref:Glucosamine 6-phosphate N-acetyltransferase n=1 Tax=Metarhizium acridum (strain CQMa 102) TaxID=655827 RepID=E9E7N2_METAQ|nr:glucosamine 6-phosphate N-acetyltransferase [Metarhizium acridum CQMa 102]EFY88142.1 glucosamine 6-phosphate N-acetyltransferase [Metarhizium acridum CQMa 102]